MPLDPDHALPPAGLDDDGDMPPPCILTFNLSDPIGAGGLAADIATVCSVGGHPTPVVCGTYLRDSRDLYGYASFDPELLQEQARNILEDVPIHGIKLGFLGSTENLGAVAELLSDYSGAPVVSYMPHLGWMDSGDLEDYLDAFRELILPSTSLLVGNYSTLVRWLLPEWEQDTPPSPRELSLAAAECGVPYVLVTGMPGTDHALHNVLVSGHITHFSHQVERFEAQFIGAGETLSAALCALLACGKSIDDAVPEALEYLDRCLESGFRPGMGHVIPDRLFWAIPSDSDAPASTDDDAAAASEQAQIDGFVLPSHDTQH